MSEADDKLAALFALDTPPMHDPMFALETARRLQQRRFWLELAAGVPWVIAASAILWALTPWLQAISGQAASVFMVFTPAAVVATALLFLVTPRSMGV